ncbi:MAG: hypothetical protein U1C66_02465 [Patescibacteria group bacterium]|nr:hypothetical protein [Patescibacteria group bacterium]
MLFSNIVSNSWVVKVVGIMAVFALVPAGASAFVSGEDINCNVVFPPLNLPIPENCDDSDGGGNDDDGGDEGGSDDGEGDGDENGNEGDGSDEENNNDNDSGSPSSGGGGGSSSSGSRGGGSSNTGGEVLGASTECSTPLLTTYLRLGQANDLVETIKLQLFLSTELGLENLVTGTFDEATKAAVDQFQLKYADEVLVPWLPFGLPSAETPTGYVYKTTQRMINNIHCAALDIPMPQLP